MTEKQISEEDLEAACDAYDAMTFGKTHGTHRASMQAALEALHSRGWRRREDTLEEAAVHAETVFDNDWQPSWKSAGYSIAEGLRALKDTP